MPAAIEQNPSTHQESGDAADRAAVKGYSMRRYFWWLFGPFLALFVVSYAAILIPALHFDRWGQSKWGPILEYGYSVRNANADVVIFGDSSAFLGIDPRRINAALGVRSVVIPETVRAMPVIADDPLQAYLAHNRAPKILVLYFTPWDLDGAHDNSEAGWYEGEEMLLRHGSARAIALFTLRHPLEMALFPLRLNSTLGISNIRESLSASRPREVANGLGHVDYTDPFPPESQDCVLPAEQADPQPDTWAKQLRAKYSTAQTTVLVYLAPIPDCRHAREVAARSYAELGAPQPIVAPAEWFAGDGVNAHPRPEHVKDTSEFFTKFLAPRLSR